LKIPKVSVCYLLNTTHNQTVAVTSKISWKSNNGGFYTPTTQVANNKDNDGGTHPGWLEYYKEQVAKNASLPKYRHV
jgi:hypothetical protein